MNPKPLLKSREDVRSITDYETPWPLIRVPASRGPLQLPEIRPKAVAATFGLMLEIIHQASALPHRDLLDDDPRLTAVHAPPQPLGRAATLPRVALAVYHAVRRRV